MYPTPDAQPDIFRLPTQNVCVAFQSCLNDLSIVIVLTSLNGSKYLN